MAGGEEMQFTGISKYYNSYTKRGRLNVSINTMLLLCFVLSYFLKCKISVLLFNSQLFNVRVAGVLLFNACGKVKLQLVCSSLLK